MNLKERRGGVHGRVWRDERGGRNDGNILPSQKVQKLFLTFLVT